MNLSVNIIYFVLFSFTPFYITNADYLLLYKNIIKVFLYIIINGKNQGRK